MQNKLIKDERGKREVPVPTAAEMRLLQVLWDLGQGSVEDVVNGHPERERPNYKTTQTVLRIMERKGLVAHESRGRVFVFRPIVSRKVVDRISVDALIARNFQGSTAGLLINLLESGPIMRKEIDEVEAYIKAYRKKYESG